MEYFVYILTSKVDGSKYIGVTTNLNNRLREHDVGEGKYSSTKRPFELIGYCSFKDKTKAYNFEKYLKHGSGYAFASKHLV